MSDSLRSRQPPIGERFGDPPATVAIQTVLLHFAPRRAARAGYINRRHTRLQQHEDDVGRYAPPDFLDDHRNVKGAREARDFAEKAREGSVTFRLQRLLQRVEMQDQGIRLDEVEQAAALLRSNAAIKLHRSEVGEYERVGCMPADIKGRQHFGMFEKNTRRAQSQSHPEFTGDLGQGRVDTLGLRNATRHTGDKYGQR